MYLWKRADDGKWLRKQKLSISLKNREVAKSDIEAICKVADELT
jgi:hypothetical protein